MIVLMSIHKKKKYQEKQTLEKESKILDDSLKIINENINVLYDQKTTNEIRWIEDLMK